MRGGKSFRVGRTLVLSPKADKFEFLLLHIVLFFGEGVLVRFDIPMKTAGPTPYQVPKPRNFNLGSGEYYGLHILAKTPGLYKVPKM